MINPFSFQGPIGRLTYALWALPIFFAQYGVGWLAAEAQGISVKAQAERSTVAGR